MQHQPFQQYAVSDSILGVLILNHAVIVPISFWRLNINTFVLLFDESRYHTGTHFQLCKTKKVNFIC